MKEQKSQEIQNELNQAFWNEKWETRKTGWDIGMPSPAIVEYLIRNVYKNAAILIPGCGNAYEAQFLLDHGYTNISLIDISTVANELLREKFKSNPEVKIYCENFFEHEGQYDIIVEQTFFCALNPDLRADYVKKTAELLKNDGSIIGLLFNRKFENPGPPFGGIQEEYKELFKDNFDLKVLETAENSILPRKGSELFIHFKKKKK